MAKKSQAVDKEEVAPEIANAPEQPQAPGLELQDLAMAVQLLHVAIKRGAYEPNELATVGTTHEKLNAFLQHQAQLQQAAAEQAAGQEGEA